MCIRDRYLIGMPICVKVLKRLPVMHLYESTMKAGRWFVYLCICMFVMYAGNLIGQGVSGLISRLTNLDLSMALQDVMLNESGWTVFLFSVILAPILEELIFRKALIDLSLIHIYHWLLSLLKRTETVSFLFIGNRVQICC